MNRYNELINQLQVELSIRNYAQSSIDTYKSCLGVFLKAMNGKPKPLPLQEVKLFLLSIQNQNYHRQFTATIHHFYKLVLKQPLSLNDIPYPRKTEYLPQIFSVQEVNKLIQSYTNLKHKAIIQLMYTCGLRIGEVVKIKLQDVHSSRNVIRIAGAKGFKDRDVTLNNETITLLQNYYRQQQVKPSNYLFEGWANMPYTVRSIQQIFKQGVKRIGITRKVVPHSLRHSIATHLHDVGVDIKDIADFLGHSQISTTEKYYLKLSKLTLNNRVFKAQAALAQLIYQDQKMIA